MEVAELDLEQYRGQRLAIVNELGYEEAWFVLHQHFERNGKAVAEFLGVSHPVVGKAWARLGLASGGRDRPRRARALSDFQQWAATLSVEDLDSAYLDESQKREQVLSYDWDLPASATVGILVPICDLHAGHIACDWARFVALCEWLKRHKQARWFLGGDTIDLNTKNSPGHSSEQFCSAAQSIDLVLRRLAPVGSQGIAVFEGNHEGRLPRDTDTNLSVTERMAKDLGLAPMGIGGFITHHLGAQEYEHFHHHGRGAARTEAAKLKMGLDIGANNRCDLVTVGHVHMEAGHKTPYEVPTPEGVMLEVQRLVMCPGFLKGRGYVRKAALRPATLGVTSIHLSTKEHQIRAVE